MPQKFRALHRLYRGIRQHLYFPDRFLPSSCLNEEEFINISLKVSYLAYQSFYLPQRNKELLFGLISALP